MVQARDGRIITFYSFKGGTGRTMALANVAWLLASSGKRVLTVDWDLESPGLPRYFNPFLSAERVRDAPGVIDLIREFDTEATRRRRHGDAFEDVRGFARVQLYAMSLKWTFPEGGSLDFISSGRQNMDYTTTIGNLGWDTFYEKLGGGRLFNALRADMRDNYDYTLIDSRTGFGDISDICTKHLPDTLVNCFTLNTQGIEGAVQIALDLNKYKANGTGKRIRVLPVPMRVDDGEKGKADTGRSLARRRFEGLPAELSDQERQAYWRNVEIPYKPFYAYEEILAAFGENENAGPTSLLAAYERLAGYVTEGEVTAATPIETGLRERLLRRFERRAPSSVSRILLDYAPEDEAWAEWIGRVLGSVGISAGNLADAAGTASSNGAAPLTLTVVSKFSKRPDVLARTLSTEAETDQDGEDQSDRRVLYISDMNPLSKYTADASESLAGQSAEEAARRITRLVGCDPLPEEVLRRLSENYPENTPELNNALVRNPRFTGRAKLLRELRDAVRTHRTTAIIPDKLPSGVGKTQLALEYVYRYKSEYDVIWWIECSQPVFVDIALVDLGRALNAKHGGERITIDADGTAADDALAVAGALGQGRPVRRWLLVFDNADEPEAIRKYIPGGPGHVLITSRNRAWEQAASSSLEIGVFDREESIAHLRWRAPSVSEDDARNIAEELGDLPVAISLTGAWLDETGTTAPAYLRQLDERGPMAIPEPTEGSPLDGYPDKVVAAFDNSLDRIRTRSLAAHRLLELCSFMSEGSISLSLIYTPAMLELLSKIDPRLADPGDIARHVQLLNRLALIKLDNVARQFTIHRLLHARIRQRLSAEDFSAIRHQVHLFLAENRPRRGVDDPETWPRYRMLWPHLAPSAAAACGEERVRSLMIDRIRYMWIRGTLEETAVAARELEWQWSRTVEAEPKGDEPSPLHTQLLHLQFNIANVLRDLAEYADAWDLDTKVLEEQRRLLGPEHRHTLMTAGGLAGDLRALGRYQEALELSEETYKTWRDVYGEDHERTLYAANNLAVSCRLVGLYADARLLDEDTYGRRKANEPEDASPTTIASANAFGRDLREAGEYTRSVSFLAEVATIARRQKEPSPRAIALVQVNLAASLRAAGRFAEATPILAEAVTTLRELLGPDHAETLIGRLCVCANLHAAEQHEEADKELRPVILAYRRLVGEDHPLTLVSNSNRVALLRSLGASEDALSTARDTVDRMRALLGESHPYTVAARMNLAACLADVGRLEEARALDEASVLHLGRLHGDEHPDSLRAVANLALTCEALGEPGGVSSLSRALGRLEELIGREHPSVIALRSGVRNHRVLDPQPF